MDEQLIEDVGALKANTAHLTEDIREIKADVKTLLAFRNRIYGMAAIIGGSTGFVFSLLVMFIRAILG